MKQLLLTSLFFATLTLLSCGDSEKKNDEGQPVANDTSKIVENPYDTVPNAEPPVSPDEESPDEVSSDEGQAIYVYSTASDGFVNIRELPNAKANIVGSLKNNGPGAKLLERAGNWYKVDFNGAIGYVNASFVAVGDKEGILGKPSASTSKPEQGKLYYVVLGSWNSLEKAKSHYDFLPDVLELGCIYKAESNGKTVYRIAINCYRTKAQAQAKIREVKTNFNRDAWVWETDALAECVYCPKGYDGEPTHPLQPQ